LQPLNELFRLDEHHSRRGGDGAVDSERCDHNAFSIACLNDSLGKSVDVALVDRPPDEESPGRGRATTAAINCI
jgi:hypothetical protein